MGFVNPLFLTLLSLAAGPVIIHMIHRQKYKIYDFSSLLFFDRSHKYNVFRLRVKHWLLMCLRIAAILLIVLAFSRLSIRNLWFGDTRRAVALVMDCSYSLTQQFGEGTAFDFAKRQALRSVAELGPNDTVSVVANSDSPEVVLHPTSDQAAAKKAIESLKPFYRKGSSWSAVRVAQDALQRVRASAKQVVVFTDLQRSAWLQGAAPALASEVPVKFAILRPRSRGNCAIVDMAVQHAPIAVGRDARFAPTIRNFSDKPVKGLAVMAGIGKSNREGGVAADTKPIDIPPMGTVKVNFFLPFSIQGHHEVWFKIPEDALEVDNEWVEAAQAMDVLPVLCLGGPEVAKKDEEEAGEEDSGKEETESKDDEEQQNTDDLFYLSNALAPGGRAGDISLVVSPVGQLSKMGLYGYNCVFLPAVRGLGEEEIKIIRQYVRRGGGLVIFLGAGTESSSLKQLLAADEEGSLMPVEVAGPVPGPAKIVAADLHRSAVAQRLSDTADQLRGVSYSTRYKISVRQGHTQSVQPLALFDDGTPAIVESRFGFGRCVLFAGGCSQASTDLPFRAIFPALAQELARQLAMPVRNTTPDVTPGQCFVASFDDPEQPTEIRVTAPDGEEGKAPLNGEQDSYHTAFDATSALGYYEVRAAYGDDADREAIIGAFGVNAGGADSDVRGATPKEVSALCTGRPVSFEMVEEPIVRSGLLATDSREVMRIILTIVLLLVIAENFISWVTK